MKQELTSLNLEIFGKQAGHFLIFLLRIELEIMYVPVDLGVRVPQTNVRLIDDEFWKSAVIEH